MCLDVHLISTHPSMYIHPHIHTGMMLFYYTYKDIYFKMYSIHTLLVVKVISEQLCFKVVAPMNGKVMHGNIFTIHNCMNNMSLIVIKSCYPLTGWSREVWKLWRDGIPWLSCKLLNLSKDTNLKVIQMTVLHLCGTCVMVFQLY